MKKSVKSIKGEARPPAQLNSWVDPIGRGTEFIIQIPII